MKTAILSLHSHGDRSFLDDRDLAVISGDLRAAGADNDVVVAVLSQSPGTTAGSAFSKLVETLTAYETVIYQRVWSREVIEQLRRRLPGKKFIHLVGEHALDDPPADEVLTPEDLYAQAGAAGGGPSDLVQLGQRAGRRFTPNLRPVVVNPEDLPTTRTFAVLGNGGCPYQADARDNPLYRGVRIPERYGKGCAFCATGNHYDHQPDGVTLARVLEQIRGVLTQAPELDHLVLKDQNPFGYLAELMAACAEAKLPPFTLMLETRADWFVRNRARFASALEAASSGGYTIAPYLVGIESFSQAELDRYNKGLEAETNEQFLALLRQWRKGYPDAMTLEHAAFGFVLFSPWTTLDDLRVNHEAIQRTRFDELRGSLLLSRARLYPDNALYYLAQRDGLLVDEYDSADDDNAARYGYLPAHPWRFLHDEVAHFARIAGALSEELGGRDEVALFGTLLDAFARADDWRAISLEKIRDDLNPNARRQAPRDLEKRFVRLLEPLQVRTGFATGWRLADLWLEGGIVSARFTHDREDAILLSVRPRGDGPRYARSRSYDLRYENPTLTPDQQAALTMVCRAIVANDR